MNQNLVAGMRHWAAAAVLVGVVASATSCATGAAHSGSDAKAAASSLQAAVAGEHRSAASRARDGHRHPVETLLFFGITPQSTVVELWPFGGWYTEILAPYLRDGGLYYAAAMDPASTEAEDVRANASLNTMLAARPDLYSKARVSVLAKGNMQIAPDGTADLVVTFRNIHNWVWSGIEKDVVAAAFRALKPGGVFGVVEHRNSDPGFEPKTPGQAYVGEDYAVKLIESAGFKLAGRSSINNNPKDTKDYPRGVWTLPPSYAMGDVDRAKYGAIGESDRFTLKFVKPKR
jgi:predicted methyltransferase